MGAILNLVLQTLKNKEGIEKVMQLLSDNIKHRDVLYIPR